MKSSRSKSKIYVRKARPTDREAVFKFCAKTWTWGDYIPKVWDKWLKEKNAKVFVATVNEVPVGISHLSIDKPHEVWLSGARTDPNYRRMGVATAITKKCLDYAKGKGAKVARLATESNNLAAQSLIQKLGFKPAAQFVEMATENLKEEKSANSKWAEETETETVWTYLKTSKTYRRSAGLYTVLFHWFSLEKHDLKRFIEQRKAILHSDKKGEVDGLILIDNATAHEWREKIIQTCYIDGDYNAVLNMVKFLKTHHYTLSFKRIYGFACNLKPITTALKKLGFTRPEIEVIYEKKI